MANSSDSSWGTSDYLAGGSAVSSAVTGAASAAIKQAGYSTVRHSCGKLIVTKAGLYTSGTLGLKATALAALPWLAVGLGAGAVCYTAYSYAADYFEW